MSSDFVSPINQKSKVLTPTAGTILFCNRWTGGLDRADFTEVQDWSRNDVPSGVTLQNRTGGDLYMWYGQVPPQYQTPAEFKKVALKIGTGSTYEPYRTQSGTMYLMVDSAGPLHWLMH